MKDEKDMKSGMCSCGCSCCGMGMGHGMMMGKHLYMVVGTFALVYGLIEWARITYMWPPYMGWVVGGVVLLVIGWLKKWFWMHKGM